MRKSGTLLQHLSAVAAIVFAAAALLGTYFVVRSSQCSAEYCYLLPGRQRFESTRWKQSLAEAQPSAVRQSMVDDLLYTTRDLAGLRRGQVLALLGEPPKTSYFREYELLYWLGPERSFISVDSEWLAVGFNAEGVVERAVLVRD